MAADRDEVIGWLRQVTDLVVTDNADTVDIAARLEVMAALDAAAFSLEAMSIAGIAGQSVRTADGYRVLADTSLIEDREARQVGMVLSAMALALAVGRVAWGSRRAARAGRQMLADAATAAYEVTVGLGPDLHGWLNDLVGVAVRLVSDQAANMVPMVRVASGISLPSSVLAYRLYGDGRRAGAMVEIAGSATPMLMPVEFDALAS